MNIITNSSSFCRAYFVHNTTCQKNPVYLQVIKKYNSFIKNVFHKLLLSESTKT